VLKSSFSLDNFSVGVTSSASKSLLTLQGGKLHWRGEFKLHIMFLVALKKSDFQLEKFLPFSVRFK